MRYGEKLIADVYNAVRASSCWEKTLLIITYDEHGGCYDHVPPPAVAPGDGQAAPDGFTFDTCGVRVPAVIISPWIPPGSVLQPLADGGDYPFDHTSIIKTVRELFGITNKLTDRDEAAPSLMSYLSLDAPFNDGPKFVMPPKLQPNRADMQRYGDALPNEYLKALAIAAERLNSGFETIERDVTEVAETVAQLGTRAIAQVSAFLSQL